jgi:hypothetical protein
MEILYWKDTEGKKISMLVKEKDTITKYVFLPFKKNYIVLKATSNPKWQTQGYWDEKKSMGALEGIIKPGDRPTVILGDLHIFLPKGLPEKKKVLGIVSQRNI